MSRELIEYKNEFLSLQGNLTYANHCNKFFDFLTIVDKVERPDTIDMKDVAASVEYYSSLGKINTTSTMNIHLESIKAFYSYLQAKEYRQNIFKGLRDYDMFKRELAEKYRISDSMEREYLPIQTVIELLKYFDEFVTYNDNRMMMISLFMKLTLIAPAKRKVIANIKFSDFKDDYRNLIVNDVKIRVPNSLRKELKGYIEHRGSVQGENSLVFAHFYDYNFKDEVFNAMLATALNAIGFDIPEEKTSYPVESIMNSAIYSLLSRNTNPILIAKLNGVSVQTIGKKAAQYGFPIENFDELINTALMNNDYYTYI